MNPTQSPLQILLNTYRAAAVTEREKGTYFEDLVCTYLRNEATYRDLYSQVWPYAKWAKEQGIDARDTGIDLVAKTHGTGEYHAIQCKFYAEDYRVQKNDIDSFFTASGKKPFTYRVIVTTTNNWSEHAEDSLQNQQPPVSKIDLHDLDNSQIDWAKYHPSQAPVLRTKKSLRDHQKRALQATEVGLQTAERGKLIMACGTGKTFTSLKIAEKLAGAGKRVLFLVPSLSLLSQTLTEWTQESETPLHSFAVCSDSDVGKKRSKDEDIVQTFTHELRYPATTEPSRLALEMIKRHDATHMSVVFSTYHSIDVISKAQHNFNLADFDLIICDEAHRTTGATYDDADESNFVKVHDASFIRSTKRLYMTATPRIYGDAAKASAEKDSVALFSMDDPALYGNELFVITFSEAVKAGLLVDYKVIVLAVDEAHVSRRLQTLLSDENNSLKVDDAAKIIGCWKALSKQGTQEDLVGDQDPMRRAVAFCQVIEPQKNAKTHKVSSKNIAGMFQSVVEAYQEQEEFEMVTKLVCLAEHVDGSMNASQKEEKLDWLKAETEENTCRILSNVRCLSEGVDVPALDAVLFLTPRNSQVDVVQSVGRVMRNAPGKKRGYVILPVVIPAGMEPHEALNDNKTYKVVWQVLQALRSHDDRFDAMVNKLDLIGKDPSKMEIVAITDKINKSSSTTKGEKKSGKNAGKGEYEIGQERSEYRKQEQVPLQFEIGEIERAIYAKVVKKVGNRLYWDEWANDIAKIAQTHISRIAAILGSESNTSEIQAFNNFLKELRSDLNDGITRTEAIEMLAQHIITKPVFDALFEGYSFTSNNPVSKAMQGVLDALNEHNLDKESETLTNFYDSVRMRASGITEVKAKQKIIVDLYEKFFKKAFPKIVERLGIVYTPVEVVDFIIKSINEVLFRQFGQTLGDRNVHIVDPFTGTGTFVARLLQSGLLTSEQLAYKYQNEIHANEIVLLAYYIAAINIEQIYHDIMGGEYLPFNGICLTDTFALYEKDDLATPIMTDNSSRRHKQKNLDIRVIFGNPPYSEGQNSANDEATHSEYPHLNDRIKLTYAEKSERPNVRNLYNSYIRAFRWASDRIGDSGVIGFVSASGFVEKSAMDGMRKSLLSEFNSAYVLNLRGDIRKNMLSKGRAREGQNIFDAGSMTGIAITILVKNPMSNGDCQIYYYDIGDDLSTRQKLDKITEFGSVFGIDKDRHGWIKITPDEHGDWINKRDNSLVDNILMGDKRGDSPKLFDLFSQGITTARDSWCYATSRHELANNVKRMIAVYNEEVTRFSKAFSKKTKMEREDQLESFIEKDPTKISWTRALKKDILKERLQEFDEKKITTALYRPFTKQWLYFNRRLNEYVYKMPAIFPDSQNENRVICISGVGARSGFSALMADCVPDFHMLDTGQCFPLYVYGEDVKDEEQIENQSTLFGADIAQNKKYALNDKGLIHFQEPYPNESITKEDIFYYVYALLHSPCYRELYQDNLSKELPRIPRTKTIAEFRAFTSAGRALAELHLNYEKVEAYPLTLIGIKDLSHLAPADFYISSKMKFGKGQTGYKHDKTTVVYNHKITVTDIPLEAYEYVVNGKPALEWVMERQAVTTHKESGIVSDANLWATETMNNPRYPLELFQRVITVSLETMKIVKGLPKLDI